MTSATGICLAAVLERSVLIAQPLRLLADLCFHLDHFDQALVPATMRN
jgi:hypothetical protein